MPKTLNDARLTQILTRVKSEQDQLSEEIVNATGNRLLSVVNNKYINTSGTTADINNPSSLANMRYAVDSCVAGDKYTLTTRGASSGRAYAFLDASGTILIASPASTTYTEAVVVAPENAVTFVANSYNSPLVVYRGELLVKLTNKMHDALVSRDILSFNHYTITGTQVIPINLKTGETVIFNVSSITGTCNVYITGHKNSGVLSIIKTGQKTFVASFDGTLSINCLSGATINATAYLMSDVREQITEMQHYAPIKYTVGTGGDYTTFVQALNALQNDTSEKILEILPGEYDIFEEMGGASYIASIDMTQNPNWSQVNPIVPPNTTIRGLGNVTLLWNPTDSEIIDNNHAFLFSPLNLRGSCKIQNINIRCSNCRYGIHDETSGQSEFNGITHVFENVNVIYSASTYGTKYAYGAGHNRNCTYIFRNCLFSSAYWTPWSTHDWTAGINETSNFTFENCVFLDTANNRNGTVRFSSNDTVGKLDAVTFIGCVLTSVQYSTEGSSTVLQGYAITAKLCNEINESYDTKISPSGRVPIKQYLTIQ